MPHRLPSKGALGNIFVENVRNSCVSITQRLQRRTILVTIGHIDADLSLATLSGYPDESDLRTFAGSHLPARPPVTKRLQHRGEY